MDKSCNLTPESTIYRQVSDELVVIQLDTGCFYYFNPETQDFLDFFREPRNLDDFFGAASLSEQGAEERAYLKDFSDFLLKNQVIQSVSKTKAPFATKISYKKPRFLRKGEKTLDEITFLCP